MQICTILGVLLMLTGCLEPPEYSVVPEIRFVDLIFRDNSDKTTPSGGDVRDQLVLTFSFTDGDGDLGRFEGSVAKEFFYIYYRDEAIMYFVDSSYQDTLVFDELGKVDQDLIFNKINYLEDSLGYEVVNTNNIRVNSDSTAFELDVLRDTLVERTRSGFSVATLNDPKAVPPFYLAKDTADQKEVYSNDSLPPYSCEYYKLDEGNHFYIKRNESFYNLIIRYYKKVNGVFQETHVASWNDFESYKCEEHSIIPVFDYERLGDAHIGNITYRYPNIELKTNLSQDTFKLQFHVYDRALHKSNVAETPEYVLSDIAE